MADRTGVPALHPSEAHGGSGKSGPTTASSGTAGVPSQPSSTVAPSGRQPTSSGASSPGISPRAYLDSRRGPESSASAAARADAELAQEQRKAASEKEGLQQTIRELEDDLEQVKKERRVANEKALLAESQLRQLQDTHRATQLQLETDKEELEFLQKKVSEVREDARQAQENFIQRMNALESSHQEQLTALKEHHLREKEDLIANHQNVQSQLEKRIEDEQEKNRKLLEDMQNQRDRMQQMIKQLEEAVINEHNLYLQHLDREAERKEKKRQEKIKEMLSPKRMDMIKDTELLLQKESEITSMKERVQKVQRDKDTIQAEALLSRERYEIRISDLKHEIALRDREITKLLDDLEEARRYTDVEDASLTLTVHNLEELVDRQTEERQQLEGALLRWKGEVVRLILHVQKMEQDRVVTNKQWREDMSILEVSKWKISQRLQKAEQTIRTLQSESVSLEQELVQLQHKSTAAQKALESRLVEFERRALSAESELDQFRALVNDPPEAGVQAVSQKEDVDPITLEWISTLVKKNRQIQTLQAQLLQVKEAQQLEKQGTQHSLEDLLANVELSTTGDLDNAQTEQSSAGVSPTKASSAPPSPQPATPASASAQQPPRENSVEGLSREERSRLALLEADKNILLVEMEYLQHELSQYRSENDMLRKQIQIMDLKKVQQRERSGLHSPRKSGLNSPRSEVDVDGSTSVSTPAGAPVGDVLSLAAVEEATSTVPNFLELQQEMDLTVAFKHLTQAKIFKDILSRSVLEMAEDLVAFQSMLSGVPSFEEDITPAIRDSLGTEQTLSEMNSMREYLVSKMEVMEHALGSVDSELRSSKGVAERMTAPPRAASDRSRSSRSSLPASSTASSQVGLPRWSKDQLQEELLSQEEGEGASPAASNQPSVGGSPRVGSGASSPRGSRHSSKRTPKKLQSNPLVRRIQGSFSMKKLLSTPTPSSK